MNSDRYVSFRCIEITQPIGTFYIGRVNHSALVDISYVDVLRIEKREVETYLGIERPLSPRRVEDLKRYANTVDATFPTSVILAVSSEDAAYDEHSGTMSIRNAPEVAKIIDGQHRIAGLRGYSGPTFELNVTVFIDMDMEDQAMVFATINLEQTKVSKSIVYSLYEYARTRSPQRTCHNIAKLLNSKDGSPFKDKIKILGTATRGKSGETLTQATFVERLLPLISDKPMLDRDLLKRGKKLTRPTTQEQADLPFRNMFVEERDAEIAKAVWNYFAAVEQRWSNAWIETRPGSILNRTAGFGALMRFLPVVYKRLGKVNQIVSKAEVFPFFEKIALNDDAFTTETYKPGTGGESALFRDLCRQSASYDAIADGMQGESDRS